MPKTKEQNQLAARAYHLKRQFNLSQEEYNKILMYQNGGCAICYKHPTGRALHVDHNPVDGHVRGLLCWGCNKGLASWKDSPELLIRAARYLTFPPCDDALGRKVFGLPGRTGTKKQRKLEKKLAKQAIN